MISEYTEYNAEHNVLKAVKDIAVLSEEPIPDRTVSDLRNDSLNLQTVEDLVALYARVDNESFWVGDDIDDFKEGTKEYQQACDRFSEWSQLSDELLDKVIEQAIAEKIITQINPRIGIVWQIEPFMEKHGYCNQNGWWMKIQK